MSSFLKKYLYNKRIYFAHEFSNKVENLGHGGNQIIKIHKYLKLL